jgi:hypothetical protein
MSSKLSTFPCGTEGKRTSSCGVSREVSLEFQRAVAVAVWAFLAFLMLELIEKRADVL